MKADARGLPIAAYLGLLVALALTLTFFAVLAIVIWLPPKPPDVMRSDDVVQQFEDGYRYMVSEGQPFSGDGMVWSVRQAPPDDDGATPFMLPTQLRLARSLELDAEQVRIAAQNIVPNDRIVFRVQDAEELRRHAAEAAREVQDAVREARQEWENAMREAQDAERIAHAAMEQLDAAHNLDADELDGLRAEAEQAVEEARAAREAERAAREAEQHLRIEGTRIIAEAGLEDDGKIATARTYEFNYPPETPAAPEPPEPPEPRVSVAPIAPIAPAEPVFAAAPEGVMLMSSFEIGAELPDGRWLVMRQGRNWAELDWIGRAALVLGGVLTALLVLALLVARRLTRPIRNFSHAVQAVGVDPLSEPVREEGPRELRGAARAVNTMQARLRALIADRTKTLAAVAHDMRTPLMRLRLAAETVSPEQRERMGKEIDEVEALVASFIAFARDDPAEEARVRLDVAALLQSIADDHCAMGHDVRYSGEERLIITGQSLGLKRLFNNLIENALKYGNCARIVARPEASGLVVDVDDDGPGVPADQRESVFEAFVRLESGEIKGAGLGLPAARSIARAHGGDVVILDGERGARVRVSLPG